VWRPANPKRTKTMLRKFAVALLAASVFTAPVLAQGGGATATPPAKVETKSDAPKVVTIKRSHKAAKVKPAKRYAHRHGHHVKHVAHVKRVKHVKAAHVIRQVVLRQVAIPQLRQPVLRWEHEGAEP